MATFDIATLRKITLLYVEDEPDLREVETTVYAKVFKDVIAAVDGEDALKKFKEHQNEIDVIITDINMPNMDGLEFIKHIKKISDVPIIVTSAHSDPSYTTQAIELGVKKYIIKPIAINEIIQDIEKAYINYKKEKKRLQVTKTLLTQNEQNSLSIEELIKDNKILEMRNEQYKTIIDLYVATFVTDNKGMFIEVSSYFSKIMGYKEEELIGKNIEDFKSFHANANIKKMMLEAIRNRSSVDFSYTLISKAQETLAFNVKMVLFYSDDQIVQGYTFYLQEER